MSTDYRVSDGEVRTRLNIAGTLRDLVEHHLASLAARSYSPATLAARRLHLRQFAGWCEMAGVVRLAGVESALFEDYQRWLISLRKTDGHPLTVATRVNKLVAVRTLWRWATQHLCLPHNPAARLELPRLPRRLPRAILTEGEVERVAAAADCSTLIGLCDRAILETLYSTGLRRNELVSLDVADLDADRGTVFVRSGKYDRDRVVPIGARAIGWTHRYREFLERESIRLGRRIDSPALFLNARWRRIRPTKLTERLRRRILAAGIAKPGSVHIFRHAMATHMHDHGADIRDLQEILGHAQLSTTEIYTHVSIGRLKWVHKRTHPAEQRE